MSKEGLSRRRFLTVAGTAAGAVAVTQLPFAKARTAPPRFTGYPFTLGVASGDPTPNGVVLWTRLAPAPLDPQGGMPDKAIPVQWEVAKDENFTQVVARGEEQARADRGALGARRAGRARGRATSTSTASRPTGRSPRPAARRRRRAARRARWRSRSRPASSTSTATTRPTSTWRQEDLDLVIHLGDYIYEYDTGSYTSTGGNVRGNSNHEIVNLADYRERHAQYKTDPDLQAAHAAFPWLVTFDDHEVDNNWADEIPEEGMPHDVFMRRRIAAFRAYWEHMPLRRANRPVGSDIQIYRRAQYGNLATFHVMDTRQFRSDQACGDGTRAGCDDRSNPARTLTGAQQEQWLYDGLQSSPAKWQILAQQVFMAQQDNDQRRGRVLQHGRLGRLQGLARQAAGLHRHARDRQPDRDHRRRPRRTGRRTCCATSATPDSKVLGSEFVGTSISTTGDGATPATPARLTENPWIKFNQPAARLRQGLARPEPVPRRLPRGAVRQAPRRADLHPPLVRRRGGPPRPEGRVMKLVLSLAAVAALLLAFSSARAVEDPPEPHVQLVEVEQMTPYLESSTQTATSHDASRGSSRTSGAAFSSQAYAQFDNHNADLSRATFPLEVEDGDLYGVSAAFVRGPNFGVVQVVDRRDAARRAVRRLRDRARAPRRRSRSARARWPRASTCSR